MFQICRLQLNILFDFMQIYISFKVLKINYIFLLLNIRKKSLFHKSFETFMAILEQSSRYVAKVSTLACKTLKA